MKKIIVLVFMLISVGLSGQNCSYAGIKTDDKGKIFYYSNYCVINDIKMDEVTPIIIKLVNKNDTVSFASVSVSYPKKIKDKYNPDTTIAFNVSKATNEKTFSLLRISENSEKLKEVHIYPGKQRTKMKFIYEKDFVITYFECHTLD